MRDEALNFTKSGRSHSASSFSQPRGIVDMSLFVARRLAGVAILAFAVGACSPQSSVAAVQSEGVQSEAATRSPAAASPSVQAVGTLNGRVLPDFATLVEQVGPAVVNVSVREVARTVRRNQRGNG